MGDPVNRLGTAPPLIPKSYQARKAGEWASSLPLTHIPAVTRAEASLGHSHFLPLPSWARKGQILLPSIPILSTSGSDIRYPQEDMGGNVTQPENYCFDEQSNSPKPLE